MLLHVLPELILQDAAGTEQAVPLVDEEEREDHSPGQEEELFAAYCKRQKKAVGITTAKSLPLHMRRTECPLVLGNECEGSSFTVPSGHQGLGSYCLQCSGGACLQPCWHQTVASSCTND